MPNVIVRKEKIGRPIWLKQRSLETVFAELVFIGIYQISIRVSLQKFHNLEKRVGLNDVVMIEKSHPLPAGECQSLIRRCRNAFMFSEVFQYDTPIARREYTQRTEQLG